VLGLVLVSVAGVPAWWLLVDAAVLGAAVLFERSGYKPKSTNPSGLQPTGEKFQDPTTGELIQVWEDPRTGTREYRRSGNGSGQ